jgi:competence protein ComEC
VRRLWHFTIWMVLALLAMSGHWILAATASAVWCLAALRSRIVIAWALVWAAAGLVAGLLCPLVTSNVERQRVADGRYFGTMATATAWQETLSGGRWLAHLNEIPSGVVACRENMGRGRVPRAGERWLVQARVSRVEGRANPHAFDFRRHLTARGVVCKAEVRARLLLRVGQGAEALAPRLAGWWWERVREVLAEARLTALERGVLWALLAGNQSLLPRAARARLATAGVAHLMAISGLHLGCFTLFAFRAMEFALAWTFPGRGRQWALIGGWLAGGWFLVVCGFPTSAVRAFVMLTGLAWAKLLGRDYDLWTWLGVATVGILGLRPDALHEAGFQLSTLAVAAIAIAFGPLRTLPSLDPSANMGRRLVGRVGELARVGAAAWSGTLLPAWWHFGIIAWFSVPVNILFVPVVSLWVLPLALLSIPLHAVAGTCARATIKGSAYAIEALDGLLQLLAPLLEAGTLPWPGLPVGLLVAGLLLAAVLLVRWRFRVAALALGITLALVPLQWSSEVSWSAKFFHVGDGDAALIQLPCGERWLVDGGPEGAGRKIISPYLRREGVGYVSRVVITHGHADHFQGLLELDRHLAICEIWTNGGARSLAVAAAIQARHPGCGDRLWPVVRRGERGMGCQECGTEFNFLWPPRGWASSDENENSLVLEVIKDGARFVLAGDLEGRGRDESGAELLERLVRDLALTEETYVVKIPHHGRPSPLLYALLLRSPASHFVVPCGMRGCGHRRAANPWPREDIGWWWQSLETGAVAFTRDDSGWRVCLFRSTTKLEGCP